MDDDGFEFNPPETPAQRRKRLAKKHPPVSRQELAQAIREVHCRPAMARGALQWHSGGASWFGQELPKLR
jgi:hypothetical protein